MQRSGDLGTLNAARQQRSETLVNFSLRCKLWTVQNSYVNIVQFTCRLGISDKKKFQSLLLKLLRVLSYKMASEFVFSHNAYLMFLVVYECEELSLPIDH